MHSQRNRCESRRTGKACSRGCFPGSPSVRRSARSIIKGQIASTGFDVHANLQKISRCQVGSVPAGGRQSNEN